MSVNPILLQTPTQPYYTCQNMVYSAGTASFSVANGTNVTVTFGPKISGSSQFFSYSVPAFTALIQGIYMVDLNMNWGSVSTATNGSQGYFGYSYQLTDSNGNPYKISSQSFSPFWSTLTSLNVPVMIKMNLGDQLSFTLWQNTSSSPVQVLIKQLEITFISAY